MRNLLPAALTVLCSLVASISTSAQDVEMPVLPKGVQRPTTFPQMRKLYADEGIRVFPAQAKPNDDVTIIRDIAYVNRNGQDLKLDLFLPAAGDERPPLVVLIHGGGWRMGDKKHEHTKAAWLTNRGYAVAAVQYRLSTVAHFPAPVNDCKAAIAFLRKMSPKHGYDPDRIAVFGGSAGGHLAALVATTGDHEGFETSEESNTVQAAILVGCPPDSTHPYAIAESRKPGSNYRLFIGASYDDDPEVFTQASPKHHVSAKTPPCLRIDEEFNPSGAEWRDALSRLGIKNDYLVLTGGIHGEWNWQPWFDVTMKRTDRFLKDVFSKQAASTDDSR